MDTIEIRATNICWDEQRVSALYCLPKQPRAMFVFAHGAGAGMQHSSMTDMAQRLATRGIGTLRYQFPYMERGSKRPDAPRLCHRAVQAAVRQACESFPQLPLFAGGRSFGGRMTSQAQALRMLPQARGLIFLSFPLHPAGKPSDERAQHLFEVSVPMLFLQGTRDELADLALLQPVVDQLGGRAHLELLQDADHSLRVPSRATRSNEAVAAHVADTIVQWCSRHE